MKKVKLCIAGLLLSGMSYGQCISNCKDSTEIANETLKWKIIHLIESVQYDIYYGYTNKNTGEYYINSLVALLPKNTDISSWCENCDEID